MLIGKKMLMMNLW